MENAYKLIVKNKLKAFGYRIKDFTAVEAVGFDFLVDDKIKVVVGQKAIRKMPDGCDVYAFYKGNDWGKNVIFFTKDKHSFSAYEIFGKKLTNTICKQNKKTP